MSAFGLKLACFDLTTSKAVEIANPKFHHAVSATRGFAFSPLSGHMAALTRSGGRDALSIHQPKSRELKRSWIPETIDAAGLVWTPDGQWLLLRESPAHGHRLLLYTPDGQLFRALDASRLCDNAEATLQPGLRLCQTSTDGRRCVIGDHSRTVTVLDTVLWRVEVRLNHPLSAAPKDTLQVNFSFASSCFTRKVAYQRDRSGRNKSANRPMVTNRTISSAQHRQYHPKAQHRMQRVLLIFGSDALQQRSMPHPSCWQHSWTNRRVPSGYGTWHRPSSGPSSCSIHL